MWIFYYLRHWCKLVCLKRYLLRPSIENSLLYMFESNMLSVDFDCAINTPTKTPEVILPHRVRFY